jgi:uncharacterized protein YqgC (DUF456 family)
MDLSILLWALASLLVLAGMVGTILPALPGPLFMFGGLVVAAWAEQFAYVGLWSISVCAGLTILAYAVDFAAGAVGAKRMGASKRAVVGAVVGAIVGLFLGLPGIILGPFVGAMLAELTIRADIRKAGRAGLGAWLGLLLGTAAKISIVFAMVGIFVAARFL